MAYNTTLNFNDFNKLLTNVEGMLALSNIETKEWHEAHECINKLKNIWNKTERKGFGDGKDNK